MLKAFYFYFLERLDRFFLRRQNERFFPFAHLHLDNFLQIYFFLQGELFNLRRR